MKNKNLDDERTNTIWTTVVNFIKIVLIIVITALAIMMLSSDIKAQYKIKQH